MGQLKLQTISRTAARKLAILFEDAHHEINLTDRRLVEKLIEGDGTYWELVKTETEIIRVIPYSPEQVVENIARQMRLDGLDDVMYDFHERQREWSE